MYVFHFYGSPKKNMLVQFHANQNLYIGYPDNQLMNITIHSSYTITLRILHEVLAKIVSNYTSKNILMAAYQESIHKWLKRSPFRDTNWINVARLSCDC